MESISVFLEKLSVPVDFDNVISLLVYEKDHLLH